MNVTALVRRGDGAVLERYAYDPYGEVTFLKADWSKTNGPDGNSGTADDGTTGEYGNEILYCGYRFDPETHLYHVRHRMYHPTLGRWMQRDPLGYGDGMNLYGGYFALHGHTDPLGTTVVPIFGKETIELMGEAGNAVTGALREAGDAVTGAFRGAELQAGSLMQETREGWTYGPEALDKWMEGKGGKYRGNNLMRYDLSRSEAIRNKIRDLLEAEIRLDQVDRQCGDVAQLETTVTFGTDVNDPVELGGQLESVARQPDRIECDLRARYGKQCGAHGACCIQCPYAALGRCTLTDRYDFHDPRNPDGTWTDAYKDKSWERREALEAAWEYQEATGTPFMDIGVDFPMALRGRICILEWRI